MKPLYGPAIVFPHGRDPVGLGTVAHRMIVNRVSEFNIATLPGGIMVVFRHDRDASRICNALECRAEPHDCRYYPKKLFV